MVELVETSAVDGNDTCLVVAAAAEPVEASLVKGTFRQPFPSTDNLLSFEQGE